MCLQTRSGKFLKKCFEMNDNNGETDLLKIICGVPKVSVLGPLLFIIYLNN